MGPEHKSTCRLLFPSSTDTCCLLSRQLRQPTNSCIPRHRPPRARFSDPEASGTPPFSQAGGHGAGSSGLTMPLGNQTIILDSSPHASSHPPRPPWTAPWEGYQGRDFCGGILAPPLLCQQAPCIRLLALSLLKNMGRCEPPSEESSERTGRTETTASAPTPPKRSLESREELTRRQHPQPVREPACPLVRGPASPSRATCVSSPENCSRLLPVISSFYF